MLPMQQGVLYCKQKGQAGDPVLKKMWQEAGEDQQERGDVDI